MGCSAVRGRGERALFEDHLHVLVGVEVQVGEVQELDSLLDLPHEGILITSPGVMRHFRFSFYAGILWTFREGKYRH